MDGSKPVLSAPGSCIVCGHCIAVCPVNAVANDSLNMDEVREYIKGEYEVDSERLLNLMKFRRSTRHFKPEPVSDDDIRKLIDAGRWCPTAKNLQGTSYIVVREKIPELLEAALTRLEQFGQRILKTETDENELRRGRNFIRWLEEHRADAVDPLFFHAPLLILVAAPSTGAYDAASAAAYMELQAAAMGLGCLYSGYFCVAADKNEKLLELLSLKEGQKIVRCLVIGYPDISFNRTVPRKAPEIKYI